MPTGQYEFDQILQEYGRGAISKEEALRRMEAFYVEHGMTAEQAVNQAVENLRSYQEKTMKFGTARQAAYAEQEEKGRFADIFSRWLQGRPEYQRASPFGQAALERPLQSQYLGPRYELAQRTRPAAEQQTFEHFLGSARPTAEQLGTQVRDVYGTLTAPAPSTGYNPIQEQIMGYYGDPEAGQARQFWASIQPWLAEMAPALRASFAEAAQRSAGRYTAAEPEEQWIKKAKELGYF